MSGLATFLEEPWRKKHDKSRKERGEGRESGRLRSRSRHRVGREVARCKTTCLFSKMTAQFSLLVFPSVFYTSTLPLLALEKASLYKDVGAACHKDTGQAAPQAPLHTEYEWRREGNNFILSIFTGRTHTHECTHSQTRSHAQARRQTRRIKTKRPPRKEPHVKQDADYGQLSTHIPSWTCYHFACAAYVSECTEGCLCNRRQAGEKRNGDLPAGPGT